MIDMKLQGRSSQKTDIQHSGNKLATGKSSSQRTLVYGAEPKLYALLRVQYSSKSNLTGPRPCFYLGPNSEID